MNRRDFGLGLLAALCAGIAPAMAMEAPRVVVHKSPTCGCCAAWAEHMRAAGFDVVTHDMDQTDLNGLKAASGIAPQHASCHTATVEGYVIEGHVPAQDVRRLLSERPVARGLSVPGMPIGSPGMEMGDQRDAYSTLLIGTDGGASVFAVHD